MRYLTWGGRGLRGSMEPAQHTYNVTGTIQFINPSGTLCNNLVALMKRLQRQNFTRSYLCKVNKMISNKKFNFCYHGKFFRKMTLSVCNCPQMHSKYLQSILLDLCNLAPPQRGIPPSLPQHQRPHGHLLAPGFSPAWEGPDTTAPSSPRRKSCFWCPRHWRLFCWMIECEMCLAVTLTLYGVHVCWSMRCARGLTKFINLSKNPSQLHTFLVQMCAGSGHQCWSRKKWGSVQVGPAARFPAGRLPVCLWA